MGQRKEALIIIIGKRSGYLYGKGVDRVRKKAVGQQQKGSEAGLLPPHRAKYGA